MQGRRGVKSGEISVYFVVKNSTKKRRERIKDETIRGWLVKVKEKIKACPLGENRTGNTGELTDDILSLEYGWK